MTNTHDSAATPRLSDRRISRRTIAKGAVWSVPVVASVTLAPQAAASATATVSITAICSQGGNNDRFRVEVTGGTLNINTSFTITATGLQLTGGTITVTSAGVFTASSTTNGVFTISNPTLPATTGSFFVVRISRPAILASIVYTIDGPQGDGTRTSATLSFGGIVSVGCTPVSST